MLSKAATLLWVAAVLAPVGSPAETRKLNIGFGYVPPLSYRGPDGRAAGFSIDVLTEAARREGLQLNWTPAGTSIETEQRLESGQLDLLPAAMITAGRRQKFFVSAPWWFVELSVLARASSGIRTPADLAAKRLALASPIYHDLVIRHFPALTEAGSDGALNAAVSMCNGAADAALMTRTDAVGLALVRPPACRGMDLDTFETPATMELAIMARRPVESVARRLRARIDEMAMDGTLAALAARHPPVPTSGAMRLAAHLRDNYQRRLWQFLFVGAAVLLAASGWFILVLRRDLAIRKRTQAKLQRSEEQLARAHRIAGLGHWEIDARTGKATCSDSARRIAAVREGDGHWQTFLANVPPEEIDRVRAAFVETLKTGNPLKTEYVVAVPGRGRRFVRQHAEAIRDQAGAVSTVSGTIQDVTDYKQLEEQFWQAQKLETVGLLAGGIAHDFNNLLTVINGYSDMILAGLEDTDPLRGFISEVRTAGERAAALTAQLLTFSRRQPGNLVPIDLNQAVRDAGKMLKRLVGERIRIETDLQPVGAVKADLGQVHQLLMNLVVNARDAMPEGGTITIATAAVHIESGSNGRAPGHYVCLTVRDTGTGMDEKTKARIFEPFFTTKPKGLGTGLGLSTVYGIVKHSGGWISVDSEPGKGAGFHVFFGATDAAPAGESGAPSGNGPRGTETILIVEDQDDVRALTVKILRRYGYQVLEVANGEEALPLLRNPEVHLDLLLTDIVMPGMSGHELVKMARLVRRNIAALFVSGYSDRVQDLAELGVPHLAKPYAPGALAEAVRNTLDARVNSGAPS